jgi:glycerol-3-phosphate acyltransferase PlsY
MIPELLRFPVLCLTAYAVGCISSGYYLVRFARGTDLRDHESGSAGSRNAGRVLGKGGFAAVFALDALKAILFMAFSRQLVADPVWLAWLAPFLVAGHIWPAQLGFRGGRGLVPALGAMIGIDIRFLPAGLLLYFGPQLSARLAGVSKGHSLPRLLSGILPMAVMPFLPFPAWNPSQALALGIASALVLWAHRAHAAPEHHRIPVTPE